MKKLVCARDIEECSKQGKTEYCVDGDTIITPSAKDAAEACGIRFTDRISQPEAVCANAFAGMDKMDAAGLCQLLKTILEQGGLQAPSKPYEEERHGNGLKVVRGRTVKMDVFDTGNPEATAYFQELVSKDESHISAGFLIIENSKFDWELTYEEIDYVIEGTLTITIDGKTYTAHAGDVLFVPSNSKVVWGSPDRARVFYATYPANWADLL